MNFHLEQMENLLFLGVPILKHKLVQHITVEESTGTVDSFVWKDRTVHWAKMG